MTRECRPIRFTGGGIHFPRRDLSGLAVRGGGHQLLDEHLELFSLALMGDHRSVDDVGEQRQGDIGPHHVHVEVGWNELAIRRYIRKLKDLEDHEQTR